MYTYEREREIHKRLVVTGREIVTQAPQLYIDVDVEADGKPGHGSLLSIGAIAATGSTFYTELRPLGDDFIPSQRAFCEEHGLKRQRLLEEGVDPVTAINNFITWTRRVSGQAGKKPVFAAFNAAFDYGFIDLYCAKAGIQNPYGVAPFDLKSKLLGHNDEWDWSATAKDKLPPILLPEGDFTHHALEDAVYQQKIHFAAAALLRGEIQLP